MNEKEIRQGFEEWVALFKQKIERVVKTKKSDEIDILEVYLAKKELEKERGNFESGCKNNSEK